MRWNDLSIPKLQRLHCWSLGMGKKFHPTLYNGCDYLSMLGLKLNHVSKRGPGVCCEFKVKYIMYYFPHWRAVCNILSVQAKLMDILKKKPSTCVEHCHHFPMAHQSVRQHACYFLLFMIFLPLKSSFSWTSWHLKSIVTWLFMEQLVEVTTKHIWKLHIVGPLWGECTGYPVHSPLWRPTF